MALIDTGLGWYADENWLRHSAGEMCEMSTGGGPTPDHFVKVNVGPADGVRRVTTSDTYVGHYNAGDQYAYALDDDDMWACWINRPFTHPAVCYISYTPNARFRYGYPNGLSDTRVLTLSSYDSQRDVYYFYGAAGDGPTNLPIDYVFNTLEAALTEFSGMATFFYKQSSGYAVSFTAKVNAYAVSSVVPHTRYLVGLISTSQAYANIVASIESGVPIQDVNYETAYQSLIFKMSFCSFDDEDDIYSVSTPGSYYVDLSNEISIFDYDPDSSYPDIFNRIRALSSIGVGEISSDDPYSGGGTSAPGGGDGTFDFYSTDIDFPGLPAIGGYATGFTTMYNPTATDLKNLADYMWAGAFDVENFRKLFADPMDAIIGLSIVPLTQAQIPGSANTLTVGNISTGISMKSVSQQYVKVSMGTISVPPKWGAYLDYAPYTKLQLFLPYIGFVDIAPDDVVGYSISVEYTVDLLSGTCVALVKTNGHVLYSFGANCSCACPVTSGQYKNGAIGAVEIAGTVASTVSQLVPSIKDVASPGAAVAGKVAAASQGALKTFDTVQSMIKPAITRSGSLGSAVGLMGIQIPYLILTVPRMCVPGDQNVYMGYPSFVTQQMSSLLGYTEIQVTHLNSMSCTDVEATEIISLLERGVIF